MYTTQELIAVFRLTIPAMADVTDAELASDIEIYRDYISERRFGKLFPKALSYFIAHMRTLNDMIAAAVADGGTAGDPSFTAGSLTREKEGDLERSYGSTNTSGSGDTESEALLKKTIYGQLFLQLRAMCIIPVTVRKGVGGCGCY
jgi:hypothetical protein